MSSAPAPERKRMELPKKREDLEKIVEEVEAREHEHYHEHYHEHEHVHEEIEDVVSVLELLVDSLNANYKSLESTVKAHSDEIIRLYKVLAKVVQACGSNDEEERRKALSEAVAILSLS
mgnify:FL=1